MNLGLWFGAALGGALVLVGMRASDSGVLLFNLHGFLCVFGGTTSAALISTPLSRLGSAALRALSLLALRTAPTPEDAVAEILRLAERAHAGGGLLSIQEDGREFAGGFAHRAIAVAIATGESARTRGILEKEIRQTRVSRQEDANVFRTVAVLAPMFGILGTLLGMIQVLSSLSSPDKVGPAMATALSSAFLGIALANFLCVPVAGQLRLDAMRETAVCEVLLDGVLDVQAGRPPYLIELHLAAYSDRRRRELEASEPAPAAG